MLAVGFHGSCVSTLSTTTHSKMIATSWFSTSIHVLCLAATCLPSTVLAQSDSASASSTQTASAPASTACGFIFDLVNMGKFSSLSCNNFMADSYKDPNDNWLYWASDAYDCLTSVPFLDAVALRFIDYFNYTIQYQSTLPYLKNPPAGYQQPAIDVQQVLDEIRQNVTAGYYQTQYDFEVNVQRLILRMHDGHAVLSAGALSAFTFGSPYSIMSVSIDGIQPPKVYIKDDVIQFLTSNGPQPSAVTAINGIETVEYLTEFAQNFSYGLLEPHADWNNLMYSPVQDILGTLDLFGWNAAYYPGDELTFSFENHTDLATWYLAYYVSAEYTGPLTTGGDFYNYFVLGNRPALYKLPTVTAPDPSSSDNTTNTTTPINGTSWHGESPAYPAYADIVQPQLSLAGSGILSGYFLRNISTAVLSIPIFDAYSASDDFSNTVANFIAGAKAANMTRVVIDLQGNQGGTLMLGLDTFHQFFPNIDPFAGSRRRDFYQENVLGDAMTDFWDSLTPDDPDYPYDYYYPGLAANEWVITDRLNAATGQNFSSWQEYENPVAAQGDVFSQTERYNLSSPVFDSAASGGWVPPQRSYQTTPPFSAENIVLLTDGACGSTCSLFAEVMSHEAGVRSVVVGGTPSSGPMQAASGSRGASDYDASTLDANMAFVGQVNTTANATLPQVRDPGMRTWYLGFNLRDQLRPNDSTPMQFKYQAADCRIYWSFANVYDMERLWRDAAAAIFDPSSGLCVAGSTGFSDRTPGSASPNWVQTDLPFYGVFSSSSSSPDPFVFNGGTGPLTDGESDDDGLFTDCTFGGSGCNCYAQTYKCPGTQKQIKVCGMPCSASTKNSCANGLGSCSSYARQTDQKVNSPGNTNRNAPRQAARVSGMCVPNPNGLETLDACNPTGGRGPLLPQQN